LNDYLEFAQKTARSAGKALMRHFGKLKQIRLKEDDSVVTEADTHAERLIRTAIRRAWPGHRILGEEEGLDENKSEFTWVIDPLDGTTNFASGFPFFAVSIGLFQGRRPVLGIIYDPHRKECCWAIEGQPAFCNGETIRVSKRGPVTTSTVAGFGSLWAGARDRRIPERILRKAKGRNLGSCVLHLAAVARGQMDFAVMERVHLWDFAAAGFILVQAGGKLTGLDGKNLFPLKQPFEAFAKAEVSIVASNARLHRQVLTEFVGE